MILKLRNRLASNKKRIFIVCRYANTCEQSLKETNFIPFEILLLSVWYFSRVDSNGRTSNVFQSSRFSQNAAVWIINAAFGTFAQPAIMNNVRFDLFPRTLNRIHKDFPVRTNTYTHIQRKAKSSYRHRFPSLCFSFSYPTRFFSFMTLSRNARRKFPVNYEAGAFMSKRYVSPYTWQAYVCYVSTRCM